MWNMQEVPNVVDEVELVFLPHTATFLVPALERFWVKFSANSRWASFEGYE
jgi:hypothetical protein